MCRKLLLLIAVLGLVGTVWADDPCAPDWRGMPGSTYAEFGYDTGPPTGDVGWPIYAPTDGGSYVTHPEKGDPDNYVQRAIDDGWVAHWEEVTGWDGATWVETPTWVDGDYTMPQSHYDTHILQLWTQDPDWQATYDGRTGVMTNFPAGSWDIFNFWSEQPAKIFQLQLTWQPMDPFGDPITWGAEMEYKYLEELTWVEESWWEPAGWNYEEGEWEGPLSEAPEGFDPWETWWEEGAWFAWGGYEESWWRDAGGWMEEVIGWVGGEEPIWGEMMEWWDEDSLVPEYEISAGGDWLTSVFIIDIEPNPVLEFFGLFPSAMIAIDQAVIDTICIPEPATIALLGLGGLALIRRRKR